MSQETRYKVLSVCFSDPVTEYTKEVYYSLDVENIYAHNMFETLDFLMDNKVNAIVVHTEIEEEEVIKLLDIINQDYENQKTPVIIISDGVDSENIAKSTSDSNVIAIFTHTNWQIQLKKLITFLKSQTLSTISLKNELVESEERNIIDPLTGALNRYGAEDTFQHLTSRYKAYYEAFSIVMLDIDHFKLVNDTHGHDIGDEVLVSISELIKNSIRSGDSFIRLGGEEFVVFIANANLEVAKNKAELFRSKIQATTHSNKALSITSSFGVTQYRENEDLESIIKRSDELLYFAKDNGRNMVVSESVPL